MRKVPMRPLGFLFLVLISLLGCSATAPGQSDTSGSYHGKVVDAETDGPIEGAVVVVLWYKKPAISMNGPQDLHKVVEVLTDAEGKFSVDASRGIDWNPGTYVRKEPWIAIFKPGYGPFPRAHVSDRSIEQIERSLIKEGAILRLPKLKTKNELRKFTEPGDMMIFIIVPYERIPNLIRLINVQRKNLGLPPIGAPSKK